MHSARWSCGADNVTLLPLPSDAPQLDPIENVWANLRGNCPNRCGWDDRND